MRRATSYGKRAGGKGNPNRPANQPDENHGQRRKWFAGVGVNGPTTPVDSLHIVEDALVYNDHADIAETEEDHIVPREAITYKQHLKILPPKVETETRHAKQLIKIPHLRDEYGPFEMMVDTTDERAIYRSSTNLLSTQKVEANIGSRYGSYGHGFMRVTSRSKRKRIEIEQEHTNSDLSTIADLDELGFPPVK